MGALRVVHSEVTGAPSGTDTDRDLNSIMGSEVPTIHRLPRGRYAHDFSVIGERTVIRVYHKASGKIVYAAEYCGDCSVAEFDMFVLTLAINFKFGYGNTEHIVDDVLRRDAFLDFREHYKGSFLQRQANNYVGGNEVFAGISGNAIVEVGGECNSDLPSDSASFFAAALNAFVSKVENDMLL